MLHWFLVAAISLVMIAVVPVGVDFLRFMFPYWRISRIVGTVAHTFLFFTVAGLVIIIIRYHIAVFLPLDLNHESPFYSYEGIFHIVFSSWLWLNVLGNYCRTISTHPGVDTSYRSRRVKFEEEKLTLYGLSIEIPPDIAVCVKELQERLSPALSSDAANDTNVSAWRPCRTHFCSICQCAIAYWDHHCPFTGGCIGLRNYSYFILCLFYGMLGSIYALVITGPHFYHCTLLPLLGHLQYVKTDVCLYLGADTYIFLLVLIGCTISSCMVFMNMIFLLADMSTYDVLKIKNTKTMFRLLAQRIQAKKFMEKDSRLNVLLLNRRNGFLWYLIPVKSIQL